MVYQRGLLFVQYEERRRRFDGLKQHRGLVPLCQALGQHLLYHIQVLYLLVPEDPRHCAGNKSRAVIHRALDKMQKSNFNQLGVISSPNPMFDYLLESAHDTILTSGQT